MAAPKVPSPTIACTLAGDGYADRMAWIAALHNRALLGSRRQGRRLILTYRQQAAADVRELARREKDCCAFLTFEVAEEAGEIGLTVSAPAGAADILDDVFAPFEQGTACSCGRAGWSFAAPSSRAPSKGLAFAAAGFSSLALTCGVCCVLPFVAPAAAAGAIASVLAVTTGFHGVATAIAMIAVMAAWTSIVLKRRSGVSRGELGVTTVATFIMLAALSWPRIEHWLLG